MKKQIDMCEGPLLGNVLRYTIPIVLTGVLQLLFNSADLIVVGWFCGHESVAAVGATGALTNLIINLFIGLSVGAGVTVAQAIGARRDGDIEETVHTAVPVSVLSGVVLTAIGLLLSRTFLAWMGTPDDVIGLSTVYMQLYFCGMAPCMLYNFGAAILRAAGDSRSPLIFLSIAGALNVVLNVIFVVFFDMNVAGVALATTLSQTLSAALVLIALCRRTDACRFTFRRMKIHKTALWRMVRIGLPAGLQGSLFSISNVLIQSSINSFGSVAMSGNAASSSIEGFVYTSMNAVQQTAMNFAGQNVGALHYDRVRQVLRVCMACVTGIGLGLGLIAFFLGRPLLGIYITDSPEAIRLGMERMGYIVLPYFLDGLMEVATGTVRGMGYSMAPTIATVMGICVFRVAWIWWIFPAHRTLETLYVSYPISWILTFVTEYLMFLYYFRKIRLRHADAAAQIAGRVEAQP